MRTGNSADGGSSIVGASAGVGGCGGNSGEQAAHAHAFDGIAAQVPPVERRPTKKEKTTTAAASVTDDYCDCGCGSAVTGNPAE